MIATSDKELFPFLAGVANNYPTRPGDFLKSLLDAAFRADAENYRLLRPSLLIFAAKYPGYRDDREPTFPPEP